MDRWSIEKRSEVMSRIRSKGNRQTELRLMAMFKGAGITGWRRHWPLLGKPDFVFRRERVVVFVDGCFWHGCPVHGRRPGQNQVYWDAKMLRNKKRDREVTRELRKRGWQVLRVWAHELTRKNEKRCLGRIWRALGRGMSVED
ncbi:MAG: very short patch repair endonuclease [Prosthecobacter sp.]|nr:very short patch repair endonuclease [Prosthecobacter sp.]